MFARKPDFIIGHISRPYLLRWYLTPWRRWKKQAELNPSKLNQFKAMLAERLPNAYLHCIIRDDDDRALHDYPWVNVSIILSGSYREIVPDLRSVSTPHLRVWDMPKMMRTRGPGSVIFRRSIAAHRLEVADGPVWSLFITGPKVREWGFHCAWGWRHWREFTNPENTGEIGVGCE